LHYSLGSVLAELDDFEGALHYFDLALASPELDEAARADATYQRGRCLEATGRQAEALEAYRVFREQFPAHRLAGRALHRINSLNRTLERNPQAAEDDD
jgi:tetratricopeptide (TPR) repeat protein